MCSAQGDTRHVKSMHRYYVTLDFTPLSETLRVVVIKGAVFQEQIVDATIYGSTKSIT